MPLKLRPTGLGSGAGKDDPDFVGYSGEWQIGRIYEGLAGGFACPSMVRWPAIAVGDFMALDELEGQARQRDYAIRGDDDFTAHQYGTR
jgi:hypothetical protein